jgi:hypothetical protein
MVRKSEKFRLSVNGCRCGDVGIDSTTARCHAVFLSPEGKEKVPNDKNSRGKKRNDEGARPRENSVAPTTTEGGGEKNRKRSSMMALTKAWADNFGAS